MGTSILIPVFNRTELLVKGLRSILRQDWDINIVILDEGPLGTPIKDIAEKSHAQYIYTGWQGHQWRIPGFAFNIGVRNIETENIILTCPEIWHLPFCLKLLLDSLKPKAMHIPQGRDDTRQRYILDDTASYLLLPRLNTKLPFLMSLKREDFIAVGGYDEDFTGWAYDDNDFVERLIANGCQYVNTHAQCVHLYHPRIHQTSKVGWYYNKKLYEERKGQIQRNIGKDWGVNVKLAEWIKLNTHGAKVVVELGAGFFDKLLCVECPTRIGIEISKKYIKAAAKGEYRKIQGDLRQFVTLLKPEEMDCALLVDIIEHFLKEEGIEILKSLQQHFNKIVIMVPEGNHPQCEDLTGLGEHAYQTHRSRWYLDDLERLGFKGFVDPFFHNQKNKDRGCIFATWVK